MVGRKVERQISLYRPVGEGWEHWQQPPWTVKTSGELEALAKGKGGYLAVPCRLVICAPLWLPQADCAMAKEMCSVELDVRGLMPKQGLEVLTVRVIETVGDRALVCAQIFLADTPVAFSSAALTYFNASALFVELDANCVHLWQEGGDIVAVFTRGFEPIYWETIPTTTTGEAIGAWLNCVCLALQSEEILSCKPGFKSFLSRVVPMPLCCGEAKAAELSHPPLRERLPVCEWKPESKRRQDQRLAKRRRIVGAAVGVGAVYVLLLAIFWGWIGWQRWQIIQVRREIAAIEPEAKKAQAASRQWRVLSPAVESSWFPLEILHRLVGQLPEDGIRLTQFDFNDPTVGIQGEARSVTAASQFFTAISQGKELSHIRWEMPPPALLPNNTARFVIAGTLGDEKN